jgi:hypothetical protein
VTAVVPAPALFSRATVNSQTTLSVFYKTRTGAREPIDGLTFLQFGLVDLPPQLWNLSIVQGQRIVTVALDRTAFPSFLTTVPVSGDYTVSANSDGCTISLNGPDGVAVFRAALGEGFFPQVTGLRCRTFSRTASYAQTRKESPARTLSQSPSQQRTPTESPLSTLSDSPSPTPSASQLPTASVARTIDEAKGLSTGAIAGIAVSSVVVVLVGVIATVLICRARGARQQPSLWDSVDPVPSRPT